MKFKYIGEIETHSYPDIEGNIHRAPGDVVEFGEFISQKARTNPAYEEIKRGRKAKKDGDENTDQE